MSKLLSSLPVGTKVVDKVTKYYGSPIVWLVGGHNHYAQGQTVLVSEKIISLKPVDAKEASNADNNRKTSGNNRYSVSNIRQWLNSDKVSWYSAQHSADAPPNNANVEDGNNDYDTEAGFLTNFSAGMKSVLVATSLTTAKNTATDGGGSEVVSDKVFLLSNTEVGLSNVNNIAEGKLLAMFSGDDSRIAYPTAEAVAKSEYKNTTDLVVSKPWRYWLRSPVDVYSYGVNYVGSSGAISNNLAYFGGYGVRPAINITASTAVSDSPGADGAYEIITASISPADGTNLGGVSTPNETLRYTVVTGTAGITVTEKFNGVPIDTKTVSNEGSYTVNIPSSLWDTAKYGAFRNDSGSMNIVSLEVSTGQVYTYPISKVLPLNAKTEDVLVAVNDMANTAMASHKKKLVDAIGNKATVGGTGSLGDITKAIETISVESMGGMKTAKGTFTTSMDDRPKVSVRGLAFKPKGILYKSSTGTPCGVYFIKEFYDGKLFSVNMNFDRISSGAISFGTSSFTPVDGGFDAMVGSYTERNIIYDYVVFG